MLLLNVRKNFSSDQKVLERFVLPVGDNRRFRIYLAESVALSYRYQCFIRTLFRLRFRFRFSWVESRDERQNIFVIFLFCFVEPLFVMRILLGLKYFRRVLYGSLTRVNELEVLAFVTPQFFLTEFVLSKRKPSPFIKPFSTLRGGLEERWVY